MPNYVVSQKIRTVATLSCATTSGAIALRAFPKQPGKSLQLWVADLTIEAADADQAISAGWEQLIPLLDRLAVITQSAFSMAAQSYLVRRLTHNAENIFYMCCTRARHPNGMPLWTPEQLEDLQLLAAAPAAAMRNFREVTTATTGQGAISALIMAAESLAGTLPKARKCSCGGEVKCPDCGVPAVSPFPNQANLEAILGTAAYKILYKGTAEAGPVRNKLMHGNSVPNTQIAALLQDTYDHVLDFLRQKYGLKSVGTIQSAPRSFTQWEYFAHYGRMTDGTLPDIALLDDAWPTQLNLELLAAPEKY